MKRFLITLLCACMLLCFFGCKQTESQATGADTSPTETTGPLSDRDPKIRLEFSLEGAVERQDATLYVGNGYSIYITDDGWLPTPGANGEVSWRSRYNGEVTITVIPNAGATTDQAKESLFAGFAEVTQDGEYFVAYNEINQFYRAARLIETPNGILAAVWNYGLESAEGFGARLRVLAGTLMIED